MCNFHMLGLLLSSSLLYMFSSNFFEGVIVPMVISELLISKVYDISAYSIEEIPGMRDNY